MSSRKSSEKEETGFKDEKEEREEKKREKQEDQGKVNVIRAKARLQDEGWGRAPVHSGSPFRCGGRSRQLRCTHRPVLRPTLGDVPTSGITTKRPTHLQNSLWTQSARRVIWSLQ